MHLIQILQIELFGQNVLLHSVLVSSVLHSQSMRTAWLTLSHLQLYSTRNLLQQSHRGFVTRIYPREWDLLRFQNRPSLLVHVEGLPGLTGLGNQTGIRHLLGSLSTQEQAVVKHFMHKSSVHPVLAEADGVRTGVHLRATCTVCMPVLFMPLLPLNSALGATRAAWCSSSHLVLLSVCLCWLVLFRTVFLL